MWKNFNAEVLINIMRNNDIDVTRYWKKGGEGSDELEHDFGSYESDSDDDGPEDSGAASQTKAGARMNLITLDQENFMVLYCRQSVY